MKFFSLRRLRIELRYFFVGHTHEPPNASFPFLQWGNALRHEASRVEGEMREILLFAATQEYASALAYGIVHYFLLFLLQDDMSEAAYRNWGEILEEVGLLCDPGPLQAKLLELSAEKIRTADQYVVIEDIDGPCVVSNDHCEELPVFCWF